MSYKYDDHDDGAIQWTHYTLKENLQKKVSDDPSDEEIIWKNTFAESVFDLLEAPEYAKGKDKEAYVYGGYVRDLIGQSYDGYTPGERRVEYNDIDIFFQCEEDFADFCGKLRDLDYEICYSHDNSGKNYTGYHPRYIVTGNQDDRYSMEIDVSFASKIKTPFSRNELDADINALKIYGNGKIEPLFSDLNILNIKKNINTGSFDPQPGLTKYREQKLNSSGFSKMSKNTLDAKSNNVSDKKEKVTMTAQLGIMDILKVDGEDAMYRIAGTQMTRGTKAALLKLLEQQGHGSERVKAISEILDTEGGSAAIAMLLGMMLHYLPQINQDPRAQRLSKEFRVKGMEIAGNAVFDVAISSFLPVLLESLKTLPVPEQPSAQLRVATPPMSVPHSEEDDIDEVVTKSAKKSQANL